MVGGGTTPEYSMMTLGMRICGICVNTYIAVNASNLAAIVNIVKVCVCLALLGVSPRGATDTPIRRYGSIGLK